MSLIERLEAAEGGSRELDWSISDAFGERHGGNVCPIYTTSLDAALALAERALPGYFWEIQICPYTTTVQGALESWNEGLAAPDVGGVYADARTPALALCIAILKAKETK